MLVGEVAEAVQKLPEAQRDVISLRFAVGLSIAETAQVLGKRQGNVKTLRLAYAVPLGGGGHTIDLDDAVEDELEQLIWRSDDLGGATNAALGRIIARPDLVIGYVAHRLNLAGSIHADRLRLVLDGANGSGSGLGPEILRATGATVETIPGRMGLSDCVRARFPHRDRDAPGILVLGHLDTVHPVGTLGSLPWRIEGGVEVRQRLEPAGRRLPAEPGPLALRECDGAGDIGVEGRRHEQLYQLAEALMELDEWLQTWRIRHYRVVARDGTGVPMATPVFDGATEKDIKSRLKAAELPSSGKIQLHDGLTGQAFEPRCGRAQKMFQTVQRFFQRRILLGGPVERRVHGIQVRRDDRVGTHEAAGVVVIPHLLDVGSQPGRRAGRGGGGFGNTEKYATITQKKGGLLRNWMNKNEQLLFFSN